MKSDLTCPVEITKVTVSREQEDTKENEQIVCLIEFFNLSQKEVDSVQMNIICFDAEDTRLGGRLVRAAVPAGARTHFSGRFMPEHVDGAVRVNAAVEKVWFKDGMLWRREDRNVREYTPNNLPEGRELDRLRAVAGADAAGYAREDDIVWMCVCGRANPTSDDTCIRCERKREQVMADYSFAAVDATAGKKERDLEQKTRDTLRRSSETTVKEQTAILKQSKRRRRRMKTVVALLALLAALLAAARWGVPYGVCWWAEQQMDKGLLSDARQMFQFVDAYWPGMTDAAVRADDAEKGIIEGLIAAGGAMQLDEAAQRAAKLDGAQALYERAVIARAQLAIEAADTAKAEELLASLPESETAAKMLKELIYAIAEAALERVDYKTAIERFESLGDYGDAQARREESIYDYGRQLMREKHYVEACDQFMLVSGRSDVISLIRQCRYAMAVEAQENGDYIDAAKKFESLGVYEEAETRAKLCRYTAGMNALEAGSLEIAAEQLKAAEDYEDAKDRFADAAFTLGCAALEDGDYLTAISWLEQLPRGGEALDALNRAAYAYAEQLEEGGSREAAALEFAALGSYKDAQDRAKAIEYGLAIEEMEDSPETALPRFEGLGEYEDAAARAKECRYAIALTSYDEGHYEDALERFEALGSYEGAKDQARRSRYALAGEKMDEQLYDEAAALYEACGAYLDAEEMTLRARYEKAAALDGEGQYEAAAAAFAVLGSYEDAKLRVTASEDAWLLKDYNSARMDMELGNYAGVIETLADLWQCDVPERYASIEEMYIDACLERAKILVETGRPLDALPLLESIKSVSKTAVKRLDAYVFRIIGRWKDSRGVEYIFRPDGTCAIAGQEAYFGGSGYDIMIGDTPYPTKVGFGVVSLKSKTLTLKNYETKKTVRLNYVGEAMPPADEEAAEDTQDAPEEQADIPLPGAAPAEKDRQQNEVTEE